MKKRVLAVLMAVATMATMVGCGDTASEQKPEASEGSGEKVWVIATDTAFKPFEYTDDNGDFVGIDMEILDAVAKDQGFEYKWIVHTRIYK